MLAYLENNNISILDPTVTYFSQKIYSATCSLANNKIYVCLANKRNIKVFNFNLNNSLLEESKDEIFEANIENGIFYKCVETSQGYVITADKVMICTWKKDNNIVNNYMNIHSFILNKETKDLLLINDDTLVSSQNKDQTLIIFNIHNDIKKEKEIGKLELKNRNNCLFLFKDYIIAICRNGITLLLRQTMEVCQYIENFYSDYNDFDMRLSIDPDNIYFLYKHNSTIKDKQYISIYKMEMENNMLNIIEKNNLTIENDDIKEMIIMNNKIIIIWGEYIHKLEN